MCSFWALHAKKKVFSEPELVSGGSSTLVRHSVCRHHKCFKVLLTQFTFCGILTFSWPCSEGIWEPLSKLTLALTPNPLPC